ncbi:MAG: glycerophosphodiester phosphodiesterase family protein [Bacteroidales bacterium]
MKIPFLKFSYTFLLVFSLLMSSKGETQNLASLDNYRIPINKKSAYIGKIHLPKEFTKSENDIVYKIIIDTAKLFRINKKGEINLRAGRVLSEGDPFRFSVTIAAYERGNKEKTLRMEFELVKDQFLKNIVVAHRGAWKESAAPQNSIKGHMVEDTPASVLTSIELSAGEYLPTVEQYIRTAMEQNKTGLVVEIKPSGKSIERTLELTDKLEQVLKIDPLAKTAYLGSNKSVEEISQSRMRGVDFNISMFRKDPLLVKKAKERGLTVNVWTVNSEEDLRAMIDLRVDYITTNEPELLFKILAK